MAWMHEMIGWLSDKLVHDETAELDRMARQLRGAHEDDRLTAVRQLTYMKAHDAVPLLLSALRDERPDVRAAAATGLGYKGNRDAVSSVAVLLGDPSENVRASAVEALDEMASPRQKGLLRFWRDKIVVLDTEDDSRVPDLLTRALLDDSAAVRAEALACLPRHGARGVATVRQHLESHPDADPVERDAPERELARALHSRQADHRKAAVETLFRLYGERAVRPLAEALRDPSAEVRQAAVEAVTALGPRPALTELLDRLLDSDEGVVVKVVEGLVLARNLGAFEPGDEDRIHAELLRSAEHGAARPRAVSAWALGEMGRVESVAILCQMLETEGTVVVAACEALSKINDPRAVTPLLAVLDEAGAESDDQRPHGGPGPAATTAAVRALARTGDVRVVPALVRRLFAETHSEVEHAVEEALATLCGAVEEAAREDLASTDPAVRLRAVRRAVSEPRLAMAMVRQVLDAPDDAVRAAALEVLRAQGYDLVALARTTLSPADKTEARRILAINLVAALQPPDAVGLLTGLLADPDEPLEVYRHAAAALKKIGSAAALSALWAMREDPREPVRRVVMDALGPQAPPPA